MAKKGAHRVPRPGAGLFESHCEIGRPETDPHSGLNIAIDSMYGAGAGDSEDYGRRQCQDDRAQFLSAIRSSREYSLSYASHLTKLSRKVQTSHACWVATDGDSDRIGGPGRKRVFVRNFRYFPACLYLLEIRGERGAIVKSVIPQTWFTSWASFYQYQSLNTCWLQIPGPR